MHLAQRSYVTGCTRDGCKIGWHFLRLCFSWLYEPSILVRSFHRLHVRRIRLQQQQQRTRPYSYYGIDVVKKTSEGHLCHMVDLDGHQGPMHSLFTKHLRPDGMGIDYSKFNYAWKDPDGVQVGADPEEEEEEGEEEGEEEKEGDDASD